MCGSLVQTPTLLIDHNGIDESFGIDASKFGNEMRFINDYRNIADEENAYFVIDRERGEYQTRIVASRYIEPGEEILTDYGEEYWRVIITLTLTALLSS